MEREYSGRMGRDGKATKKGKKEKILKDRVECGEVKGLRSEGGTAPSPRVSFIRST